MVAGQLDPVHAAAVLDDAVGGDVDVLGVLDPELVGAGVEVRVAAVHADDRVRAVARHPDDPRLGEAREDAVDAAARRGPVREQALGPALQLVLDVDRLGQRLLVADEGVELEVAGLRPGSEEGGQVLDDQLLLLHRHEVVGHLRHAGGHVGDAAVDVEHPVDRPPPAVLVARPAAVEAGRAVAAEAAAQHDVARGVGRIEGVEVDDLGRPVVRGAAAVVALGARAPRRRALLGARPERGQGDVDDGRLARPHLDRGGRRLERLLDHRDVVGARRQVVDVVAAVHGVDGVGDAVDGVVRLHAEGAHLAVVGRHPARDDAAVAALGEGGPAGKAGAGEQHRPRRDGRGDRTPAAAGTWLLRHRLTSIP